MPTLSPKARPVPPAYPFYGARLAPAPADRSGETDMSIVLLQGGGLSKDQFDRVPLHNQQRPLSILAGMVAALFTRPVAKD